MESELRLAVLIDADNAPRTALREIMAEVAVYGSATIKRIYGDWTAPNMGSWKPLLLEHAITPFQQYSYTTGKNATDSAMIIDAMDILYSGNCDGFVLVSSDSDFTRLATRLREAGMKVYGMGERKTPQPFIVACDKFIYVEVIRGIPLLVQLFYIYYALSRFFQVSGIASAVTAISICYGAYMGEVFRACIMAMPKGQSEAARSLGFNRFQTMFLVILPQAWRTILPPVGNECIAMLKDTSLVSILAVPDIMQRARSFVGTTYLYFETYTVVALIYLIITLILSKCVSHMEGRLNHYDGK